MALETRLTSLDVFRGLTIFAMIIVNDSGDFTHTYPPLLHAQWDHITPTDLIFPFFLFIVGVGLAAALRPYLSSTPPEEMHRPVDGVLYRTLARRALVLVLLGLLINGFPEYHLETWRIPGVLQRIGICFFLAAILFVRVPLRWQWGIGGTILLVYATLLRFVGALGVAAGQLEPTANLPRSFDLVVFSKAHVFSLWPTEPEGILSTPAAVVSVLLGCWVGIGIVNRAPSCRRGFLILAAGVACAALGWVCSPALPIVKMIWTPTYVLFAGGCAMMCFALMYLLTDVRRMPRWIWVAQVFGRNAILAYVLSELAASALSSFEVRGSPFPAFVAASLDHLGGEHISAEMGSLLYACLFTLAIWAVLYFPYKRRWFVRV